MNPYTNKSNNNNSNKAAVARHGYLRDGRSGHGGHYRPLLQDSKGLSRLLLVRAFLSGS